MPGQAVRKAAVNLNGVSIAYIMGTVNAALALLVSFGVGLNNSQVASITALINAAMILTVHMSHRVGEAAALGRPSEKSREAFGVQRREGDGT